MYHRNTVRSFLPFVCLVPVSLLIAQIQADLTRNDLHLEKYLNGDMGLVFRSRVLSKWLIEGLMHQPLSLTPPDANFFLQCSALFGLMTVMYLTGGRMFGTAKGLCAALLCAGFIPWAFLSAGFRTSYPYDNLSILFSAAGLYAVMYRRRRLFTVIVGIGCLNKESIFWLIPAYFFASIGEKPRARQFILYPLGVFLTAYAGTRFLADDRGGFSIIHRIASLYDGDRLRLTENIRYLLHPPLYIQSAILPLLAHAGLVRWKMIPARIRRCYYGVPFYLIPILFCGNLREFRLLNELLPLGALCLASLLTVDVTSPPPSSASRSLPVI